MVSPTPDLRVGLSSFVCVEGLWMIMLMVADFFHWVVVLLWAITPLEIAITRRASRTSLPDGSRLVKFLDE